jgi:RHS repeat-associated protein
MSGNTRLTFADLNNNGVVDVTGNNTTTEILNEYHYYPFGMNMAYNWTNNVAIDNKYQYNGKEMNDDFALNLNDYGARWYDAALGRWSSVDPLGEKMRRWTPYNYCFGNPWRFIDPDGMRGQTVNPIGDRATAAYNLIKENASPERKEALRKLEESTVAYNIQFETAENMPGTSLAYTTGAISADGKEAVVNMVIGDNGDVINIATLGDELEHASQFENNELAIAINQDGSSGILAYDCFDEAKSKDASVEASLSLGNELQPEQRDWVTAKANGTTKEYFTNHGYVFNGRNGTSKPTSGSDVGGGAAGKQELSNKYKNTIINREDGKTNIVRPQH